MVKLTSSFTTRKELSAESASLMEETNMEQSVGLFRMQEFRTDCAGISQESVQFYRKNAGIEKKPRIPNRPFVGSTVVVLLGSKKKKKAQFFNMKTGAC